ncbi:arginine--tRNA ligase [Limnochorda pilosa]|uniref:Arginine--tRNA ligase n=1 Tax=Limnochorda pilosa TaxID=1555112 RepID=A0A0K2SQ64_LIMPI|nr:arginine--tRNA ligase [Limnochorda pilosa]BAS28974.1 arginyl-tRNA synthetase [Limnochorda pilosa]
MDLLARWEAELNRAVRDALERAVAAGRVHLSGEATFDVEVPREKAHGDFSTNAALVLARSARMRPRDLAEILVAYLDAEAAGVERVEVAGPGFINFRLHPGWLHEVVPGVLEAPDRYGESRAEASQRILVEFVSANPTGPMNVVNARAAAVGDVLARCLAAAGHPVATEYYVNDAGHQVDLFARTIEARCRELQGEPLELPEGAYQGEYVREVAGAILREHPDLLEWEPERRHAFLRREGPDRMVAQQREDLERYGVRFDRWFRERDLHAAGKVDEVARLYRERGMSYEEDGAVWLATSRFGDEKDRVVVKRDGQPTYLLGDIAYHREKLERGFERLIDLWGPDHHGHIVRTKAALEALGYPPDRLEVLLLQLVTLTRGGQPVRMSKRAGEFITLRDLVDEVGVDAARFTFLTRSLDAPLDFDLELAVRQSDENPVYYVQYAHARIASVFRQAFGEGADPAAHLPDPRSTDLSALTSDEEDDLLRHVAAFPSEVRLAADRREPHRLSFYAQELARRFHVFYAHHRILGESPKLEAARLLLARATQLTLRRALDLMGVSAPDRM